MRKRAHVLLGPTVNLYCTPIGGWVRVPEDPELTARLAVPYVRAVQAYDVAVTVKHCRQRHRGERGTVDVRAAEASPRAVPAPVEATVTEADLGDHVAYNRPGSTAHHHRLLSEILRDEWGLTASRVGLGRAHDTVGAISGGLTAAMPGPETIFGEPLAEAATAGHPRPTSTPAPPRSSG